MMQRITKVPFLANIYVCERRSIIKDISLICRKLDLREAKEIALAKTKSFGKPQGRCAALYETKGLFCEERLYISGSNAIENAGTSRHEEFHAEVSKLKLDNKSKSPPLEESAAYAYETMTEKNNEKKADSLQRYRRQAYHSVRFLFSFDRKGNEDILIDSMIGISSCARGAIGGDDIAIAIGSAVDCMFYIECVAVLRRWGLNDGKRILLEAVGVSDENGANAGRDFLLKLLPFRVCEKINSSYGVNLEGFRFRSFYSLKTEYEVWEY